MQKELKTIELILQMVCWRICLADIKSHKLNLAEGALPPDYPKDNQACKKYVDI